MNNEFISAETVSQSGSLNAIFRSSQAIGLIFSKSEIVCWIDSNLPDLAEKIPDMVKAWEDGFDFVVGCRDEREEFFVMKIIMIYLEQRYWLMVSSILKLH